MKRHNIIVADSNIIRIDDEWGLNVTKLNTLIDDLIEGFSVDDNSYIHPLIKDFELLGIDFLDDKVESTYYIKTDINKLLTDILKLHSISLIDFIYSTLNGSSNIDTSKSHLVVYSDGCIVSANLNEEFAKAADLTKTTIIEAALKAEQGDSTEFENLYDNLQSINIDDALEKI